ncbi:MAG: hypothetical protein H0T56_13785 [Pseudaminobacter sp.]|nr:hypothetical protein [Pseudaminobacter sp.]
MNLKMLSIAALALTLSSGAFAQTNPPIDNPADPSAQDKQNPTVDPTVTNALDDPAMMTPFYTDDTMTTMRPVEEMRTAWTTMTPENQALMQQNCETTESIKYKEFCGALPGMIAQ